MIASGATLAISGTGDREVQANYTLHVDGTANWAGTDLTGYSQTRIEIGSGGVLNAKTDQTIVGNYYCTAADEPLLHVEAGGTLTKSAGSGTTTIEIVLDNDGTTSASSGTLSVGGAGHGGSGELEGLPGGVVAIAGDYAPEAGATVTGNGVALTNGNIVGLGTLTVEGTLKWTGNGNLGDTTNAGETVIASGATLAMSGTGDREVRESYTLHVDGTATWIGTADLTGYGQTRIEIGSGGILDAKTNQTIVGNYSPPPPTNRSFTSRRAAR